MNIDYAFQEQGRGLAKDFCHLEEAFFERIYINREVVQEASVWFYIKWMGKRNEPINSSSEVMGNGEVSDCFLSPLLSCFQFVFLLLNQGDSF